MKDVLMEIIEYYKSMSLVDVILLPPHEFSIALTCLYGNITF